MTVFAVLFAGLAVLSGCVVSVPPKPAFAAPPAPVQSLKLHLLPIKHGSSATLLPEALAAAMDAALREYGFKPAANYDADGMLEATIDPKAATFTPYHTTLNLLADGRKVESVDLTGGALGNNMNISKANFQRIAEGIASNLVAKLAASPKVADFAREPRKVRVLASAAPAAGLDKDEMKKLMLETLREASAAKSPAAPPAAASSDVDTPRTRTAENPDNFALVIGVEKYSNDLPEAQFAERDAQAVKSHLLAMGYPERNIKLLQGSRAVRSSLEAYLEDWLPKNVKPEGSVFVYFSGHGAPDPETGHAYLVPWDGDPSYLARTAYPLKRLYGSLKALKAKRVLVALDSCFSGAGGRSVLQRGTRPLVNKVDLGASADIGKLVVFTASDANQISGTIDSQAHGLFTYFFLKGLDGAAADARGGVTAKGLHDYLAPKVADEANRGNRTQSPMLLTGEGHAEVRLR
ncbi:MAG: caspase family protein [Elusimicrobia bacterium]|nr:caspase family protein [Elusimicrobiota bacterium]